MDLIGLLGLAASIGVPAIGGILTAGKLWQMIRDHGADITDLRVRVQKAEDAAIQVAGLAKSIEHMGERFTAEMRHLVDTFSLETAHTRTQLGEIKEDLRAVRTPARRRASDAL